MSRLSARFALSAMLALMIVVTAIALGATPATVPAAPHTNLKGTLTSKATLDLQKPDLSRAVVYLAADPALDQEAPPKAPVIVSQHDKKFVPDFAVVARHTTIEFPNEDPFDHNVFSRSKAAPAFDLDRYPKGMSKSREFTEVGIVQVFCNIHPSMRAMIVVTPNRYFARADDKGNFSISDVPAGHYTLVAWHERCDDVRKPIDLSAAGGGLTGISLELKQSRQGIMAAEGPPAGARESYGLDRGLGVKQEKLNLPVVTDVHPAPTTAPCCDN